MHSRLSSLTAASRVRIRVRCRQDPLRRSPLCPTSVFSAVHHRDFRSASAANPYRHTESFRSVAQVSPPQPKMRQCSSGRASESPRLGRNGGSRWFSSSVPRRTPPDLSTSAALASRSDFFDDGSDIHDEKEMNEPFFDFEEHQRTPFDLDSEIDRFASSSLAHMLPEEASWETVERTTLAQKDAKSSPSSSDSNASAPLDVGSGENSDWGLSFSELDFGTPASESGITHDALSPRAFKKKLNTVDTDSANFIAIETLKNFDPENPPPEDDLDAMQMWLECSAQKESVLKYQKILDDARKRKAFDSVSALQKYVVRWYQQLFEAIDATQKEFITNTGKKNNTARKRYGPFLCTVQPEKLAVVTAHEALMHVLTKGSSVKGKEGVPLLSLVMAIGEAVQTEVLIQKWLKHQFKESQKSDLLDEEKQESKSDQTEASDEGENSTTQDSLFAIDKWSFTATHMKKFLENEKRLNPNFTKSKRAIGYSLRRVKQMLAGPENWTSDDKAHLGAALLSILIDNASVTNGNLTEPAFRIEKSFNPRTRKTHSYVVLHTHLSKLFLEEDVISFGSSTMRHLPMVTPPRDWTSPDSGGYRWLKIDLMRFHGSRKQKEILERANLPKVYDGLNKLGKTPWRINKKILEAGEYCWDNNIAMGDIPSRTDHILPPEPEKPCKIPQELFLDEASPERKAAIEERKAYREALYRSRKLHQKNMDLRSLRCSAVLKLNQAAKFRDFDRIYFPYNLDFRGRAYPVPPHLSNVGSDLCRGMLKFAVAKPLGKRGLYWLKVHLANFAGKDKMSFDDRAKFIDDNIENVRDSVINTFGENPWWMTLEDPFQGLATCHEIINAIDSGDPQSYMCALPVHMDGSCNGLQHYAALGRDVGGGKAVNLLESDGPQDVYVGVMHEVIRRVAEDAESEIDFDISDVSKLSRSQKSKLNKNKAAKLVNGLIDRGVVKRTVMTSVYGVTLIGARQQILEKIEEKLEDKGYDVDEMSQEIFGASMYLASMTMDVMGDLFQGARNTQNWLAECARLISLQEHPVSWISPIGVPAMQPYTEKRSRTIVTVMQTVTIADNHDDLPIHKSRQVTAFPPNYVHSLDSSHMLLTALEMDRRGLEFSAVHDSFWTHACDVDEMNVALRDCFVDLYSRPLLEELKESWEHQYPEIEFPELPQPGDLDLNDVTSATYFFQ